MAKINPYYKNLTREYIFPIIDEKLATLKKSVPQNEIINLGIGDIALPLAPSLARAIKNGVEEMTTAQGQHGYGPSEGYAFLRETICQQEYARYGLTPQEIFISDGTNSDATNLPEIFDPSSVVAIPDPSYPAYLDASVMAGKRIVLLPCLEENRFSPKPPAERVDLVYLCTPSNPTGQALNRQELTEWVDWAKKNQAMLLIDNVYNCFITSKEVPASVYEIPGAQEVAIEMRSFSKCAGFTGLRCAYAVVPKALPGVHALWVRRVNAKSNGVAYPIQRGAEAYYSLEGTKETRAQIATYQKASSILRIGLQKLGHTIYGGIDAPYIWWKTPNKLPSWDFFDQLIQRCHLIAIPGRGFGKPGEGYMRLSCFTTPEKAAEALYRIENRL